MTHWTAHHSTGPVTRNVKISQRRKNSCDYSADQYAWAATHGALLSTQPSSYAELTIHFSCTFILVADCYHVRNTFLNIGYLGKKKKYQKIHLFHLLLLIAGPLEGGLYGVRPHHGGEHICVRLIRFACYTLCLQAQSHLYFCAQLSLRVALYSMCVSNGWRVFQLFLDWTMHKP